MNDKDWEYLENYEKATGHKLGDGYFIDNNDSIYSYNDTFVIKEVLKNDSLYLSAVSNFFGNPSPNYYVVRKIRNANNETYAVFLFLYENINYTVDNCNISGALILVQYNRQLFVRHGYVQRQELSIITTYRGHISVIADDMILNIATFSSIPESHMALRIIWRIEKSGETINIAISSFGDLINFGSYVDYFTIVTDKDEKTFNELKKCKHPYLYSYINKSNMNNIYPNFSAKYEEYEIVGNTAVDHNYYSIVEYIDDYHPPSYASNSIMFGFDSRPIEYSDEEAINLCLSQTGEEITISSYLCSLPAYFFGINNEGGCLIFSLFLVAIILSISGTLLKSSNENTELITYVIFILSIMMLTFIYMIDLLTGLLSTIITAPIIYMMVRRND